MYGHLSEMQCGGVLSSISVTGSSGREPVGRLWLNFTLIALRSEIRCNAWIFISRCLSLKDVRGLQTLQIYDAVSL